MTTKLYHRLKELDNRHHSLKNGTPVNVYAAVAERAGCSIQDVTNLAFDGPHSGVNVFAAKNIISAVGIIQGRPIGEQEMMMLFANDPRTNENNNPSSMSIRYK